MRSDTAVLAYNHTDTRYKFDICDKNEDSVEPQRKGVATG